MQIDERIKSERKRLGFNQTEFAEIAHATRGTASNWETGTGSPDAKALAALAVVGLDVLYVVTGQRSFVPPPKLSAEEETMLELFKDAPKLARRAAMAALLGSVAGNASGGTHQSSGIGAVHMGQVTGVGVQAKKNK